MEYIHVPVLYKDVMENLSIRPRGCYVDGTLGGGGHALGICQSLSWDGHFIGIDKDAQAIEAARINLADVTCKKDFVQNNYSDIKQILSSLGKEKIDGALLDLGVSSFQLDNPQRGFSYMQNAPLDMRMDSDDTLTAETIVNEYKETEINRIIHEYGEERWAARIANFIVKARQEKPIETTEELVEIIKAAIPSSARRDGPHPAKRTFQAIRIEVNDELGHLERAIDDYIDVLASGGRLAVITFHSLEDRIVKNHFNKRLNPCTCPKSFPICVCGKVADVKKITGKPVIADEEEKENNPRARSAKLRVIEKL
jgi:16S rRNA (cytosine1402-N4)-methyltransferase